MDNQDKIDMLRGRFDRLKDEAKGLQDSLLQHVRELGMIQIHHDTHVTYHVDNIIQAAEEIAQVRQLAREALAEEQALRGVKE